MSTLQIQFKELPYQEDAIESVVGVFEGHQIRQSRFTITNNDSYGNLITEYGIADLRGKDDLECAWSIIQHCAHPAYRDQLSSLLRASTREGGHHPLRLNAAFSWHQRFQETGSMLPAKP